MQMRFATFTSLPLCVNGIPTFNHSFNDSFNKNADNKNCGFQKDTVLPSHEVVATLTCTIILQ